MPTVALGPNPHWVIIDNFSKLPAGAVIYTKNFFDISQDQPAYTDAGGSIPFSNPIPALGAGNGTFPPIYWLVDTPYYIAVWTGRKEAAGSTLIWDFSGILASSSGGGGGPTIVTNNVVENLVINGTFYRPLGVIGSPGVPLTTSQLMILAPSNNHGYVDNPANAATTGYTGPDIAFVKSNAAATDSISFNEFSAPSLEEFLPDVTPPYFVNYTCTVSGGETYKYFQFPISNGIVNLSGQTVTVRLWANSQSGSQDIRLVIRQFYGDGGAPSADIATIVGGGPLLFNAFNEWTLFAFTVTLPTTPGTIGSCGNDATFLQIQMPLGDVTSFSFIKPGVFLTPGTALTVQIDYHTNDYIDSIVSTPRTGDIRTSLNAFSPYGWVPMNDGTIGSTASAATTRNNVDTFPLYDLIWRTFKTGDQTLAPMSGGVYGASPIIDFTSNRTLALTKTAGRLLAAVGLPSANSVTIVGGSNTGTTWAIGQTTGNELHTQSVLEMPNHSHPGSTVPFANVAASRGGGAADTVLAPGPGIVTVAAQGGGTAFNVQQPTSYLNIFVKL